MTSKGTSVSCDESALEVPAKPISTGRPGGPARRGHHPRRRCTRHRARTSRRSPRLRGQAPAYWLISVTLKPMAMLRLLGLGSAPFSADGAADSGAAAEAAGADATGAGVAAAGLPVTTRPSRRTPRRPGSRRRSPRLEGLRQTSSASCNPVPCPRARGPRRECSGGGIQLSTPRRHGRTRVPAKLAGADPRAFARVVKQGAGGVQRLSLAPEIRPDGAPRRRRPGWLDRQRAGSIYGLVGVIGFLLLWEFGSRAGVISEFFFSRPTAIVAAGIREVQLPRFWNDVRVSSTEFVRRLRASPSPSACRSAC